MNLKKLIPLIGFVILSVILFHLDISKVFQIVSKINTIELIISLFVFVPLLLLANIEWQMLLKRQKINVSFWYSIKNFFIGYFYGFITPGGLGGYARSFYLSKESGAPLAKCVSNIVTLNTIEFLAMLSIGFVGALFLTSIYPYLFVIILIVVVLVLVLYGFFFKSSQGYVFFQKIIRFNMFSGIKERLQESVDSFHKDVPRFKDILLPFSLSITGWLLKYVMFFFIARLFDITISFYLFILIMAVADVIGSIPISIYGIGTREAALLTLFSVPRITNGIVISSEQVVSFSLFCFVIIWLIPSIIGGFVTLLDTKRLSAFNLDEKNCKDFETYMRKYQHLYAGFANIVKQYVNNVPVPVIVDLGVGPGLLSKEIKELIPEATIIGVDPSVHMLKRAENNAFIETRRGSSDQIPLENDSVDVLVTRFSLTYWEKPQQSFQEINRVLKPNGIFIIEALNKDFSRYKLLLIKIHMILKNAGIHVARYHIDAYKTAYTIRMVIDLLEKNDFSIIHKDYELTDWRFLLVGKKRS